MRTLAAITLTKGARASKSTASFPACETSATTFKSPRCRQPHDRRYRPIHPSELGQRSTHRPPDGGQTARSRRLCFYLVLALSALLAIPLLEEWPTASGW